MSPRLLLLLSLGACAGPATHRAPLATQPEAVRAPVATTLASADPLAATNCGLPTTAEPHCAQSANQEEEHQPQGDPMPAPTPVPKAEEHHHGGPVSAPPAAPRPPSPPPKEPTTPVEETRVIDPVCKMSIDPKTAKGGSLELDGKRHWFCSSTCRRTFLTQNPGAK